MAKNNNDIVYGEQIKDMLNANFELLQQAKKKRSDMFTVFHVSGYVALQSWIFQRGLNKYNKLIADNPGNKEYKANLADIQDVQRRVSVNNCGAILNAIPAVKLNDKYGWCASRVIGQDKDIKRESKEKIFERLFRPFFRHTRSQAVAPAAVAKFMQIKDELNIADRVMHIYFFLRAMYPDLFWSIMNTKEDLGNVGQAILFTRDGLKVNDLLKMVPVATIKSWHLFKELEISCNPQAVAEVKPQERMGSRQFEQVDLLLKVASKYTGASPGEAAGLFRAKEKLTYWEFKETPPTIHPKLEWLLGE